MADIQSQHMQQKQTGAQRCIKKPVRVDLTPMVDLGFLLITFFVFTTSLSRPTSLKLALPSYEIPNKTPLFNSNKALTLVLINSNLVGYYYGGDAAKMQFTSYAPTGLRSVIIKKQAVVAKQYGDAQQLMVLIKPSGAATYKNVVQTLDEMLINSITRYMLLDMNEDEQQQLKRIPQQL